MAEHLSLKWGTLKGWNFAENKKAIDLFDRYVDLGASMSAMAQRDTPEQKQIICDLIDAIDGEITNDWSGEVMTKEQAKEYVMTYGERKK
jgi:hypothetical protein